jgi:hypothetical protein
MAATTGGTGSYSHAGADRRLSSQWSFSRQDLPQISETGTIPDGGGCNSSSASAQPYSCYLSSSRNFSVSSWDDTGSILLPSPGKKLKLDAAAADDMVFTGFSSIDSQVRANVLLPRRCLLGPPHGLALAAQFCADEMGLFPGVSLDCRPSRRWRCRMITCSCSRTPSLAGSVQSGAALLTHEASPRGLALQLPPYLI